ncbi:type II secretion system F family protein [Cellulomonas xiejunii]|uniref:type II secretion system F family protein n=1 Tax=Cellulomonas xiejunii TaxID=2968083 RepID=UPI001D0E4896|nr:type II secretion system F family protein [Cellulomonas xiejunii]MCC2315450.1 type II secretion system F family protein [Cellulomonas xiejunii]
MAAGGARGDRTDLAGVLHAVAAQVRAGVPPGAAWAGVLGAPVEGQVPGVEAVAAAVDGGAPASSAPRARVRAVVAGARVAAETGAPLADVLEHLAEAVAADAEQAGDLEAALAGPRATARVLTSLPVLGLLVGSAMGARPWQVLTDGGLGSALGVTGIALVVAGRVWVGALLRRAGTP